MKKKSASENKFRYVSFTEQIAKVSVDITRWHPSVVASAVAENETHFNDAVIKYRDVDYGSFFENFLHDIPYFNGELRTYAQLLHQKDVIAKALINHLNVVGSTSLCTLLGLTTAFAQDLRDDFQIYLWEFLETIIAILECSHENKDLLETGFFTLAKIFWLQRKRLVYKLPEFFIRFKRVFCCKRTYLRRFIAEALAILLRKSKTVGKTSVFLAETVNEDFNRSLLIDGISRLYFNALKVNERQFHSTAPELLSQILQATLEIEKNDVQDVAVEILKGTIQQCSAYTSKNYSELLVKLLLDFYCLTSSSSDATVRSILAKLLTAWISEQKGKSLHNPSALFQTLISVMKNGCGKIDEDTVTCLSLAIKSYHQESALHTLITSSVYTLLKDDMRCDFHVLLRFLYGLFDLPLFDLWIMPLIGLYMSRLVIKSGSEVTLAIFRFYADICSRRRPVSNCREGRVCFFDPTNHLEVRNHLVAVFNCAEEFDEEVLGCCLITYPWLWRESENPKEIQTLIAILESSMSSLNRVNARIALLAANALFLFDPSVFNRLSLTDLLKNYRNMGSNETALRVLALILPHVKDSDKLRKISVMKEVAEEISPMFGHHSSDVRRAALEIMLLFDVHLSNSENDDTTPFALENPFSLLLKSEKIPWTLHEYRARLVCLRQLSFNSILTKYTLRNFGVVFETIPLRIVIGNLYEPFTIAWSELEKIIEDYAYGLHIDTFFCIILHFIEEATLKIKSKNISLNEYCFLDKMISINETKTPDYVTFRLEMFRVLARISHLSERQTKLISPLFINFFKDEFQQEGILGRRENTLRIAPTSSVDVDENDIENNNLNKDSETLEFEKLEKMNIRYEGKRIEQKLIRDSLITLLELFSNFTSPKTIYLAKEVQSIYNELLMVCDESVQYGALKCLFTYKYEYLKPYREYLENLAQERTLLNSLLNFCVDGQNLIIDSSHRAGFMAVLLRILFGKCGMHTKRDMAGRRTAIFQFLVNCTPDELNFFFNLLFAPLLRATGERNESLQALCSRIVSAFDASSMLPLVVIKGSLRSTLLIATKLSPTLTDDQQRFLFRICITSALLARLAMDNLAFIQPHLVKRIRNLRVLSCNAFKEVFHASQDRHFVIDELNSFITYIVTPQCLYVDGNAVPEIPLSLLRLFLSWTSIPKLFFLLRLQVVTDGKAPCSLLSILCNMLSSKSISNLSKEKIIDGIFDLLTLADEITTYAVPDNILFPLPEQHGLSSGFAMVISELPKILAFIFASLPSEREKRKLKTKHLELLSRVSDFIQDGEMIEQYISVLLTFVNSGTIRSDDVIRSLLLIVSRMMAATPEPIKFLKQLVNPQSSLTERSHREALQKVEEVIAVRIKENDKRKAELLNYIISFDSWDASRIGEPDYDERHNAYSGFSEALTSNEVIDPVILCLALHNDYYVITQFSDISLRSGATRNFRNIIEYFEKFQMVECDNNEATIFIILKLIVKGLSIEKELIRHDFVKLLVAMITCFPMHKHLRFLLPLRNTADIDLDFFENIIHLQIHRRQRALYKLTQSLRTEEVHIPNEILHQFVLPLFKPYLSNLSSSTSALSDAALGLLKQIMSRTPWKKYFSMLNYYLKRLKKEDTNDKSLVRIIVAIVEAFHFNVWDEAHNPALKQKSVHFKINETGNISSNSKEDSQVEDLIVAQVNSNSSLRSSASCIYQKIVEYLIPQLKDCATGKDLTSHRKAHSLKYYKEDDEIRRAPVALATVKLLQKMPQKVMDDNLHGVVIKMCSLLMSRSVSVREAAGKTVIEITKTLGSKYICFIIREMKQTMTKGYQIHVMIFYIHKLLSAMEFQLSTGDLDSCLIDIVEVCNMDLFGDIADEKSVSGITKDVPEAKTQRTYETYRLLGRYISSNCLDYVLETLKKVVESRPDTKTMQKVGRLLRQYSLGISANEGIESKVALVFAYHILKSEVLGVMKEGEKPTESGASETKKRRRAESCLLLEKEPGRMGVIVKVSTRSKMHVFIEFGMCELYSVLKNKAFDVDSNNDIARLDPFVNIVLQCLHLKYDQILVYSLRCFLILLKFPLPSLRSNIAEFLNRLFILLADYAAIGAFGSAHEYVRKSSEVSQLLFKSLTQIIRDAPHLVLISKRLQLLLTYVETDVADNQKQAVAFPLIKAIITRKLQDPKIPEIIHYLSEISIMSEISHIREQCRQVILQYVGTHPQSKKPAKYIEFFLEQLEYQYEDGRRSAIEMLNMLFQKFTEKVNDEYALFAYVKLSARLMNDESKECRRMVSLAIQQLINSVSGSKRNDLYLATQDWLKSNKEIYICTAMQLLVMFSKDSGENIENTLRELSQTLSRIFDIDTSYSCAEENILIIIDNLTSLLRAYSNRITQFIKVNLLNSFLVGISSFASSQKSPLIQLSAAQFFGFIFAAVSDEYLLSMSDPSPRQLMQWMLSVMKSYELNNALAEQTAKNIVYLFDPVVRSGENLDWLVSRFKMICRFEIVRLPAEFTRRISIFKVIAAVVLKTDLNQCRIVIRSLLPVLYREMQGRSTQTSEELRRIALEVVETIKRKIGEDEFTKRITECHRQFDIRSQMRKRKRKEDFVLNPVNAALKKQRKNKVKQKLKAKKRRIS